MQACLDVEMRVIARAELPAAGSTSARVPGISDAARVQPMSRGPDASEGGNKSAAAALRARLLVG